MIALSYKSTHYATIALKVLVLGLTAWYLVYAFGQLSSISWQQFQIGLDKLSGLSLTLICMLSLLNWLLEFKKWKLLASILRPMNFWEAAKQSLISFSLSIATPNRLGEYPVKALFFPKASLKKVLWLNLGGNMAQLLVTLILGLGGLLYMGSVLPIDTLTVAFLALLLTVGSLAAFYLLKAKSPQGTLLFKRYPLRAIQVLLLAVSRYSCFGLAFALLLGSLSGHPMSAELLALTTCYYLLISIVPTWLVLDVVVKGGTAVWLFSWIGLEPLAVMTAVLIMWLLNYLLPALAGAGLFGLQPIGRYD